MLKSKVCKCLLVVLSLFVVGNVFALTWDELKAKIEAKYKGFSTEIKDMELVMVSETKGVEGVGPVESKMFTKGEKYRMETKMEMPEGSGMPAGMGDMETVVIFDGKDLWSINQFTGKQKLPADATAAASKTKMTWWENLPAKGKIIGSEKIGDKDCYIVEAWEEGKKDEKIKEWIDKASLLSVQMEFKSGEGKTFKTVSSNFKKVKEWEMPYTTEVFTDGKPLSKTTIKTLEINKGLSDDLFDADKVKVEGKGVPGMPNMKDMMKKFKPGQ